jgi:FdhD protein
MVPESVATEEPLEIRVAGPGQEATPAVVTMRTPGHDFELAAGFLVTEGLSATDEVAAVAYCDAAEPEHRFNTVTVSLRRPWDPASTRRDFMATSACGVCGKSSIDAVELSCPILAPGPALAASLITRLPDRLRAGQRVFESTGGLHAAGLFDAEGELTCLREDVGRHNAVDKVVGHLVLARRPLDPAAGAVLMVSGRLSFEIVQKAAMAGIAVLAAVSAPSSLAVSAAERLGLTIAGFVRGGRYNVYTHPERIDLDR